MFQQCFCLKKKSILNYLSFSTNNDNVEELNLLLDRLILPEGFNSETLKMMEFSVDAANKYKNKRFIFRFHPMMNSSLFIKSYIDGKIKIPKNLIISNNLFNQDLDNSKYIIYRGSAAAIQALALNKIVIYLQMQE